MDLELFQDKVVHIKRGKESEFPNGEGPGHIEKLKKKQMYWGMGHKRGNQEVGQGPISEYCDGDFDIDP